MMESWLTPIDPCDTQSLILLCPLCPASIPSALWQLDIIASFNIMHKLAFLVILPALFVLLLAQLVLGVLVHAFVNILAGVVKRGRAMNHIIRGVLVYTQ